VPVLIVELVDLPKMMPGPPVASTTASAANARISIERRSWATMPTHRPAPPSSRTIPRNSQNSNLLTLPATSQRRACSSSAYRSCCPVVAPAYAVRWWSVPPKRRKSSSPSGVRLNMTPIRSSR
jgi:hypothetical protein